MPIADSQALNLYIESVVRQAQAEVCAVHVSGFQAEFAKRFAAWRGAHAEALASGQAQAEAAKPSGPGVQHFAAMNAQVLASLPADDRFRRCQELLALFKDEKP